MFGAGCAGQLRGSEDHEIVLRQVEILNRDNQPHTVHLVVDRDGETVHRGSHRITASEGANAGGMVVELDVPASRGRYEIRARVDENREWATLRTEAVNSACPTVIAFVESDGDLTFLGNLACERTADDERKSLHSRAR